jgi:Protein of unknown function (DUF2752)
MIIKRAYSVPEQLTLAGVAATALAAAYPKIIERTGGRGLPCPLRTLTGVPCPFCGLTTATVALTHGRWADAAKANPLAYAGAAAAIAIAPILVGRTLGKLPAPKPLSARDRRLLAAGGIAVTAGSWLYQLRRADLI